MEQVENVLYSTNLSTQNNMYYNSQGMVRNSHEDAEKSHPLVDEKSL
jgi:hypothetical protein